MCGIFGYVGKKNPIEMTIQGLKKLEYRGYDSAGIAGIKDNQLYFCKEVGKVSFLEAAIEKVHLEVEELAIAQTRWATHGKPNKINAHPHLDSAHTLAVVHNGIVENHESLRQYLKQKEVHFISETDTEVISHLISSFYQEDLLQAVSQAVLLLKGNYAFALIHRHYPGMIVAVSQGAPLVIGRGIAENFISSDAQAFAAYTRHAIFLNPGEIALIQADQLEVYDESLTKIEKKSETLLAPIEDNTKGLYEHYTLKEIHEQPQTIRNALAGRLIDEYGTAVFEELNLKMNELLGVQRILILACGTSWHAGYIAAYMLEDKARIPVQVEISSEFRYKNPVVSPDILVIAISQSGETADTIAAIRELKAKGSKILALCNVQESTLARESDACIFLKAGPEVGVCSTKAFTSQLVTLALFTLLMARMRNMNKQEGQEFLIALKLLPDHVQKILDQKSTICKVAKKYAQYDNFFFIGRNYMYPTSLEGALKLKEISYINANGYPAGEMKHGPIALINEKCPTVALCANKLTTSKMQNNLMEIKARNGLIMVIAEEEEQSLWTPLADTLLLIPDTRDELAPILTSVVTQLLAYYIAKERGAEIDQPRNLAKSVTVE